MCHFENVLADNQIAVRKWKAIINRQRVSLGRNARVVIPPMPQNTKASHHWLVSLLLQRKVA
jgi:hypothetical protein